MANQARLEDAYTELSAAIRSVLAGRIVPSSVLDTQMLEELAGHLRDHDGDEGPVLSSREREVLQSIAEGRSPSGAAS